MLSNTGKIFPGDPTPPFIDPPKGGLGFWADDRPWYWNKTPCPANCDPGLDLSAHVFETNPGGFLEFQDAPGGFLARSSVITFVTFVVSDYGDKTYKVLSPGIMWTDTFDADGNGTIMAKAGAMFETDYNSEIGTGYGWTFVGTLPTPTDVAKTPEPGVFILVFFGLVSILFGKRRQNCRL